MKGTITELGMVANMRQRAKKALLKLLLAVGRVGRVALPIRVAFYGYTMPVVIFSQTLIIKIDRYYGVRLKRTITVLGLVVGLD